jgi:hypothetical protein
MIMEHWWNCANQEKEKYSDKTPFQSYFANHISHCMTRNRTRASHSEKPATNCIPEAEGVLNGAGTRIPRTLQALTISIRKTNQLKQIRETAVVC